MHRPATGVRSSALARALRLLPLIERCAERIDRERALPLPLVGRLVDDGLFRLLIPAWLGGEALDWLEYLAVIRALATADGSTAWCVNQACVFATTAARVPESLAHEVWGDARTVVANGPPARVTSQPVPGGFRLSGRWMFSSGCRHASWMAAVTEHGDEEQRLHLLPRAQVELVDVWDVQGLRGTGSFHFEVEDRFVPEARTALVKETNASAGPLYAIPRNLLFACGFAAVALGVARAAIDGTLTLARHKRAQFARCTLAENPVVQGQIGLAEARWRAAGSLLDDAATQSWERVNRDGELSLDDRLSLRLASTHAIRQSAEVVDLVYQLSGSDAVFSATGVQRRFQDAHAITQQIQGREAHYESVGQHLLGLTPRGIF